ncbi:Cation efflux protein, partial [human gut metagenome]
MAGQKPDSDHPFGHGRIEYISGLLVSILIVLMGFELVKSSVSKIFHPEAPDYSPVIIGILVFS